MICPCKELQELRRYKRQTEKLLRDKKHEILASGRHCETLVVMLKRYIGEEKE